MDLLRPTTGARIKSKKVDLLGLEIGYWDLGGQLKYRDKYLEEKQKYFANVSIFVYVIDIRMDDRFDTALDYLKQTLTSLKEFTENPRVHVLFHKYDSEDIPNIKENADQLKQKILDLEIYKNISFYKTTIYDKISLIRTFSEITAPLSEKLELIRKTLKQYRENTFSSAVILFDSRFLVESFSEKGAYIKVLELVTEIYAAGIERLEEFSLETSEIQSEVSFKDASSDFNQGTVFILKISDEPRLYLVTLTMSTDSNLLTIQEIDALKERLLRLLNE